ncbi:MAG: transposase, partial [Isosphaeraceae bacterium]
MRADSTGTMAVTRPAKHPDRSRPSMTSSHLTTAPCQWFSWLAAALDRRSAPRLALLLLGAVLARGRRTLTTWIRAAKLSDQFRPCYTAVAAAGKRADRIARRLLTRVVRPLLQDATRLTLALDDTPTRRYGPHVQGAGVHHNPTSGPAGSPCVYGHVFVVLGLLVAHPVWGVVALPLLARLYVRKVDLPGIDPKHRPGMRPCGPCPTPDRRASATGPAPTARTKSIWPSGPVSVAAGPPRRSPCMGSPRSRRSRRSRRSWRPGGRPAA